MNCDYMDIRCSDISCDLCEKIQMQAYNKAIDDFSNALADDLTWLKKLGDEVYDDVGIDVRIRAEQLKAGGENE